MVLVDIGLPPTGIRFNVAKKGYSRRPVWSKSAFPTTHGPPLELARQSKLYLTAAIAEELDIARLIDIDEREARREAAIFQPAVQKIELYGPGRIRARDSEYRQRCFEVRPKKCGLDTDRK